MVQKSRIVFLFILILACFSCSFEVNTNSIDLDEIKDYFETDNISINYSDSTAIVTIENYKKNRSDDIGSLSGMGALIINRELRNKNGTIENIQINFEGSQITYSKKELNIIQSYFDYSNNFLNELSKNNFENAYKYVNDSIDKNAFLDLIQSLNLSGQVKQIAFEKFDVINGKIQLYSNIYFKDNSKTSLIIIFLLNEDNKIDGIQPGSVT